MHDVLLVGQTPPPTNGQTTMIKEFLDGEYKGIRLHHVRMKFSRSIDEVGTLQLRKLWLLATTLVDIIAGRIRSKARILYFPPAGPTFVPVVRDMFLLICTRWMFDYTVFHFHAAGLTEIYPRLPRILRPFFRLAYYHADLAVFTAESRRAIGVDLQAKKIVAVPYGIADNTGGHALVRNRTPEHIPTILFMGILCEGKGLLTLLEACSLLHKQGFHFRVVCAGAWDAATSPEEIQRLLESYGIADKVSFPGILLKESKWEAFASADIFCFPSHYFAESSPVVITEAMSFALPIVATAWRGIPDLVESSGGAFLVEVKRPDLAAARLSELLANASLRERMGEINRERFLAAGTLAKYRFNMEVAIISMIGTAESTVPAHADHAGEKALS